MPPSDPRPVDLGDWLLITVWTLGCGLAPVFVIGGATIIWITEETGGLFFALVAALWLGLLAIGPIAVATGVVCLLYRRGIILGAAALCFLGLLIGATIAVFVTDGILWAGAGAVAGLCGGLGTWMGGREAILW